MASGKKPAATGAMDCTSDPEGFQIVQIHTAKCAKCDQRNKSTMHRCPGCTYQICQPCFDKQAGQPLRHGNSSGSAILGLGTPPARRRFFGAEGSNIGSNTTDNSKTLQAPSAGGLGSTLGKSAATTTPDTTSLFAKDAGNQSMKGMNMNPPETPLQKRKADELKVKADLKKPSTSANAPSELTTAPRRRQISLENMDPDEDFVMGSTPGGRKQPGRSAKTFTKGRAEIDEDYDIEEEQEDEEDDLISPSKPTARAGQPKALNKSTKTSTQAPHMPTRWSNVNPESIEGLLNAAGVDTPENPYHEHLLSGAIKQGMLMLIPPSVRERYNVSPPPETNWRLQAMQTAQAMNRRKAQTSAMRDTATAAFAAVAASNAAAASNVKGASPQTFRQFVVQRANDLLGLVKLDKDQAESVTATMIEAARKWTVEFNKQMSPSTRKAIGIVKLDTELRHISATQLDVMDTEVLTKGNDLVQVFEKEQRDAEEDTNRPNKYLKSDDNEGLGVHTRRDSD